MPELLPTILPLDASVLAWGVTIHMIFDWLFQTEWMACNKTNLAHPAAWVHSGLHTLGLLLVFPWFLAVGVGISHLLIDTRKPLTWWIENVKQMPRSTPNYGQIEMWLDQVFHVLMIIAAVILLDFLT